MSGGETPPIPPPPPSPRSLSPPASAVLVAILVAGVGGFALRRPLTPVVRHGGVDVALSLLVLASAATLELAALRQATRAWVRLVALVVGGLVVLAPLAWLVARVVPPGTLRDGVLAVGLAPVEVASIATASLAGADVALGALALVGSVVVAVLAAGPVLALEAPGAGVAPFAVAGSLGLVVALPLVAGVLLGRLPVVGEVARAVGDLIALAVVVLLVALVSSQVRLERADLDVLGALALFLVGAAAFGGLLGLGAARPVRGAVLLDASMRDFAIAAGIATAAFGARAAAPLAAYGVLVLAWGALAAMLLRRPPGRGPTARALPGWPGGSPRR